MFDSQSQDLAQRPLKAISLGHLARESRLGLNAPRTYLVPVLFWITAGQGRMTVDGTLRGYTAHNAIYLPANTPHSFDISARCQGAVAFFGGHGDLPRPSELIHLRVTQLQKQTELNQLLDGLRQDSACDAPYNGEILYHRAALTLLWLAREATASSPLFRPAPSETPLTVKHGRS
ncbi:MAG: hypothetical protein ACK5IB_11285 [Qingshengfaniella sp.]